ncbi:hypothetical protein LW135_00975 [Helicobacter sp. faydin-H20]|uniref:hypothetical protein n=1 Tax=Helicobacter anatolicus TaxID=2905874 RepID=UPI001E5D2FFC|nr:hypothetical protein [Helicobacter anatolicus]MCE3036406.1 hypothetical protein [Helicobacter anatolicus]
MRSKGLFFISLVVFLYFVGCSQRKPFVPERLQGSVTLKYLLPSELDWANRNGVVLKDGGVISGGGKTLLKLKEKEKFLNETQKFYIIAKDCNTIELIDKEKQVSKKIHTSNCAISANIKDNFLAYVLIDNSYGISNLNTGESLFNDRGASVIAINTLNASPVFLETLVVFPTLDGQLISVSLKTMKVERTTIVHSEKFFSNVIFLQSENNKIFSATPKKIISLVEGRQFDYEANIRDLKLHKGYLYVLTLDGRVVQLDATMRVINEVLLPYAVLSGIVIINEKLFTMEHRGYLIEVDLKSFDYNVYMLQDILGKVLRNKMLFYDDSRFYYYKYYIDFSKVWKK